MVAGARSGTGERGLLGLFVLFCFRWGAAERNMQTWRFSVAFRSDVSFRGDKDCKKRGENNPSLLTMWQSSPRPLLSHRIAWTWQLWSYPESWKRPAWHARQTAITVKRISIDTQNCHLRTIRLILGTEQRCAELGCKKITKVPENAHRETEIYHSLNFLHFPSSSCVKF